MSFAAHAKEAEQAEKKELPPLVAQELTRVIESESAIRIRTFREKFSGILDTTTLDVLDTQIAYLEAENESKKQRENQEFCDEQYMVMVKQLMKDHGIDNPLFATVKARNVELTAFLLSKGYDFNIKWGNTDIFTVIFNNPNSEILRMLVEHGLEIPKDPMFDFKFTEAFIPTIYADSFTNRFYSFGEETVLFLLKNNKIPIYEMLIFLAIAHSKILVVDYILNKEPLLVNNNFLNQVVAHHIYLFNKNSELLMLLLKHGLKFLSKEEGESNRLRYPGINYTNNLLRYDDDTIIYLLENKIISIYYELYVLAMRSNRTALVTYIHSTGYNPNTR